jgi:hypothetical protein
MSTLSGAQSARGRQVPAAGIATTPTHGWIARLAERRRARQQHRRLVHAVRAFTG